MLIILFNYRLCRFFLHRFFYKRGCLYSENPPLGVLCYGVRRTTNFTDFTLMISFMVSFDDLCL